MKNKVGAAALLTGTVIFIVLNVIVIAIMILGISRVGTAATLYEEGHAKQIALLIDAAKPGTTIKIDLSELYQIAIDTKVEPEINIDCEGNKVLVRVTQGEGSTSTFFTKTEDCEFTVDKQKRRLTVKV